MGDAIGDLIARIVQLKHGPDGTGRQGPCDPDCQKCDLERQLKELREGPNMKSLNERLLDAAKSLERENYHTEASLMREAAGYIVPQPAPGGRTRRQFDPILVKALSMLIYDNGLHAQHREDTIGVLMRCGVFHAEPVESNRDGFIADLATAIDNVKPERWQTGRYSVEKVAFGDLEIGEHFIGWPIPGDNGGHGGYKGQNRLFVKTEMTSKEIAHSGVAKNGSNVPSTFPHSMTVIRVILT